MLNGEIELKYWLNVDKPTYCVLHTDICYWSRNKKETSLKGIGEEKEDGGWLPFANKKEAIDYFEKKLLTKGYKLSQNCNCLKKDIG